MNAEELELLSDSKYRQFINAVEKALKSFEYSSEWADLISALGKLNKVGLYSCTIREAKIIFHPVDLGKYGPAVYSLLCFGVYLYKCTWSVVSC